MRQYGKHRVLRWQLIIGLALMIAALNGLLIDDALADDCPRGRWETVIPRPRAGFGAAFDEHASRTVLFGGEEQIDAMHVRLLGDTWTWDGAAWTLMSESGPSPRTRHAMAYDAARGRTVLFGGTEGASSLADTWEWDGSRWILCSSTGPVGRFGHAMAYDARRSRVVMFGGRHDGALLDDFWEWNGTAWAHITSPGPSARLGHAMAYDADAESLVLFGGYDGAYTADTWIWNGVSWSRRDVPGPAPRAYHAAAFDASRGRVVLMGGLGTATFLERQEMWEWDGEGWTLVGSHASAPINGAIIYDAARTALVGLFGEKYGIRVFNTYERSGAEWVLRAACAPYNITAHAMMYDEARGTSFIAGGTDGASLWDGSYEREPSGGWTRLPVAGPGVRYSHSMAWDADRGVGVLFGGRTSTPGVEAQTWEWNGTNWTLAAGTGPAPRRDAAMAYDRARGLTVLLGGDGPSPQDWQTWVWDGATWTIAATTGPRQLFGHAMAYDEARNVIVLFGSPFFPSRPPETWEWDGAAWTLKSTGGPAGRNKHAMAYDPRLGGIILFGGIANASGSQKAFDDLWLWNGAAWMQIDVGGPAPRYEHAMVFDHDRQRLVLTGGSDALGVDPDSFGDTWEYVLLDGLGITRHPEARKIYAGDALSLGVDVQGGGALHFQWKQDGRPLSDGAGASGSRTSTLTVAGVSPAHAGRYTVEVSNDCELVVSNEAVIDVLCRADLNQDLIVDFADYLEFLTLYDQDMPAADLSRDGVVDFADYLEFLNFFSEGC